MTPNQNEKTFWDYTVSELDGGVVLSAVKVTDRIKAERGFQNAIDDSRALFDAGKKNTKNLRERLRRIDNTVFPFGEYPWT
ncbi:MAG TPA: hypothetical protein VF692_11020, partial [Pyrinomonadaceae bacterium]